MHHLKTEGQEAVIYADHVVVNERAVDAGAEVLGTGEHYGLMPMESQTLMLDLQVPEGEEIESFSFDLTFYDENDDVIGTVAVMSR